MIRSTLIVIALLITSLVSAQEDEAAKKLKTLLDSLDFRIKELGLYLENNKHNRDARYFATNRELGISKFIKQFEQYIYAENLVEADRLVQSKIKLAAKRYANWEEKYYLGYASKLTKIRAEKQRHYQKLFEKEKNFRAEYYSYIEEKNEASLRRARRMVELAIQYANTQSREETLKYLHRHLNYTDALLFDLNSKYDLAQLTSGKSKFHKTFDLLVQSDSLDNIREAEALLGYCLMYSASALPAVDTNYLNRQKNVVHNAITDWTARRDISGEMEQLTGAATITRFDSLNREGIYKWNDKIVVIGNLRFSSNSEMVRRGEIILNADRTIYNYMRVNRVDKMKSNSFKTNGTYILPFNESGKTRYYKFNQGKKAYQYMVCYSSVINKKMTVNISRFLPPMQFEEEVTE